MESEESGKKSEIPELQSILDDPGGSQLLENYLKDTGNFVYLEFIWACKGMKALISNDKQKNKQLVNCIYRQYILNGKLSDALSNKTFLDIVQTLSQNLEIFDINSGNSNYIFDQAEVEVQTFLESVIYPNYQEYLRSHDDLSNLALKETQRPLRKALESSSALTLNDDGLPKFTLSNRSLVYDLKHIKRPPTEPNIFAEQLCKKLETLQKDIFVSRLPKYIQCAECQKEEIKAQEGFTIQLTKAIEEKLCSSVNSKTFPAKQDEDMAFLNAMKKQDPPCCETGKDTSFKLTSDSALIEQNRQNDHDSTKKSFFKKLHNRKARCSNAFKKDFLLCISSEKTLNDSDTRSLMSKNGSPT